MKDFTVFKHASICIGGNIYIDPFKIENEPHNAKAIFITHKHFDHYSPEDIKKVSNESTRIFLPGDKLPDYAKAFPAYNINKWRSEGVPYHPKSNEYVGYILEVDGFKFAICGDTDFTPELAKIKCDVLFVPIGGTYTMTAKEAAECANAIKPKLVVPVHYNTLVGGKDDEKEFIKNLDKNIMHQIFL